MWIDQSSLKPIELQSKNEKIVSILFRRLL